MQVTLTNMQLTLTSMQLTCNQLLTIVFLFQAFGSSKEELDVFLSQGILRWGEPVSRVMTDGDLVISQIKTSDQTSLITMLLEGEYYCWSNTQ